MHDKEPQCRGRFEGVIGSYRVLGMRLEGLGAKILTRLEDKSKQTIKRRNRN